MPRSKAIILVTKLPKSTEKQRILKRNVAQIHANAVIRHISSQNISSHEKRRLLDSLLAQTEQAQDR